MRWPEALLGSMTMGGPHGGSRVITAVGVAVGMRWMGSGSTGMRACAALPGRASAIVRKVAAPAAKRSRMVRGDVRVCVGIGRDLQ